MKKAVKREPSPIDALRSPGSGANLSGAQLTYVQDVDSCQSANDICQTLTVTLEDNGMGVYPVIETTRWAMDPDEIDQFAAMLKAAVSLVPEDPPSA